MEEDKNSSFRRGAAAGAFCAVLCCLVIGAALNGGVLSGDNGGLPVKTIESKIASLQGIIDEHFLFDEDLARVENGIYKGMMAGLNDPYTVYYTADEFVKMMEETNGEYCGIGAQVSLADPQQPVITNVFEDSPAEKAGLLRGDVIGEVDGVKIADIDPDLLVSQYIRGKEGTYVELTVLRDGRQEKLHIQRGIVAVATVESRMLEGGLGYIQVKEFDNVTAEQFKTAVGRLEDEGMKQLVIDLRNNPGGVLDAAVEMAAYLLPEDKMDGTIVSTADKHGRGTRYYCSGGRLLAESNDGSKEDQSYPREDGHQLDIPIAILLNGYSASSSEVFAGALRDYGAAKLVGTTSFGKGIVQSVMQLNDGSAVKVTVAHYYTPGGFDLHGKGLEPDVEEELDEALQNQAEIPSEEDNQLKKAVEVLRGNTGS